MDKEWLDKVRLAKDVYNDKRSYTRQSLTNIPELQDCVYLNIDNYYRVIRCPKSSTTTNYTVSSGKSSTTYNSTVVSE